MQDVTCSETPVDAAQCSQPLYVEGTAPRRRLVASAAECDCCLSKGQGNNLADMPLSIRHGGALARTLYRKTVVDQELRHMDKHQWYAAELDGVSPDVRNAFVEMDLDAETVDFLDEAEAKSECIFTQIWHALIKLLFGWFFTQTSLNGFLGRGSMFVFSAEQYRRLMDEGVGERLLDIGAGDGAVTARMERFFEDIDVTEVSNPMRRLLTRRKYRILEVENWTQSGPWDVISCLNVLDRCARPNDLLKQIHDCLTPEGRVVIALVLPYHPYVEVGGKPNHQPDHRLPIEGISFEEQVESVIKNVFRPAGFRVLKWTRLPYLCEGDLNQAYYWLSDAVFVLRKSSASDTL